MSAKIDLSGLKNDSYYGNKLCFSGDLLTEVLDRFIISSNSTDEEINKFAEELCTEHQNSLLVIELTQKNEAQLKQIEASAIQTASLAAQLTEKQELIVAQERQIAELNVQLAPRPKAEVAETNEISALKTQLTLVNEELEATRAQLKRQESATKQKGPLAFPLYGRPFHGFSPFFATFDSQQMRKLSQLPNGNSNQADPIQATDTPSV